MQKIPTIFVRDPGLLPSTVVDQVTPGCQWVLAGEGRPTRKYNGTCVMLDDKNLWWARREVRPGRPLPANYLAVCTDDATGKIVGWEPIEQSPYADLIRCSVEIYGDLEAGTYELVAPEVNGNPERVGGPRLIRHGYVSQADMLSLREADPFIGLLADAMVKPPQDRDALTEPVPMGSYGPGPERSYDGLRRFLALHCDWEGIVYHHQDGRMAKIKGKDFPQ